MRLAIALAIVAALGFAAPLTARADSHEAKAADETPAEVSAPPSQPGEGEKAAAEGEEKPADAGAEEKTDTQPE